MKAIAQRIRYQKRAAAGVCTACGNARDNSTLTCGPCRELKAERNRRRETKIAAVDSVIPPAPQDDRDLEVREIVIPVQTACRRKSTQERIREGLTELRRQGYEVELRVRGSWRTRARRVLILDDAPMRHWEERDGEIRGGEAPLARGPIAPAYTFSPPPALVLHGTKLRSAYVLHQQSPVGRVALVHLGDV